MQSHQERSLSFSEPPPGPLSLLKVPAIRSLTISGFFLCFLSSSYGVVFALFAFTPVDLGGLGFEPTRIGYALSVSGIIGTFFAVMVMPWILLRWPPARIYQIAMGFWPVSFAILPALNHVARIGLDPSGNIPQKHTAVIWTGIVLSLASVNLACCAYGCVLRCYYI